MVVNTRTWKSKIEEKLRAKLVWGEEGEKGLFLLGLPLNFSFIAAIYRNCSSQCVYGCVYVVCVCLGESFLSSDDAIVTFQSIV